MRAIDGFSSGASARSASKFSSRPHRLEDGDHATGLKLPSAIRASASPELTISARTNTGLPPTFAPEALNASICSFSSGSFSGEYAKWTSTAPAGAFSTTAVGGVVVPWSSSLSPPPRPASAIAPTASTARARMAICPNFIVRSR